MEEGRREETETLEGLVDSGEAEMPQRPPRVRIGSQVRDLPDDQSTTAPPLVVAGEVLAGKYRLVRALGEGGMGSVWEARNDALDIDVAVKIIRPSPGISAKKLSQRMQQEARAAARLDHPAIVRITDVGETPAGDAFCVMELLNGEDVAHFLEHRGRLGATKAIQVLLPIAHALALAHEKGIVHRDLKPENIFLAKTDDGGIQPKLIDFGIAKIDAPQIDKRITQNGVLLGSPAYMSPEQARGEDVDARGDIWSFSVVLYEMLTNVLPFEGKNYHALIRSIVEDEPAPTTDVRAGDDVLWDIIARGLAKDPSKRWPSLRQLGAALAQWLERSGVHDDICGASLAKTWARRGELGTTRERSLEEAFSRLSLPDGGRGSSPPPPSSRVREPQSVRSDASVPEVAVATHLPVAKRKSSLGAPIAIVALAAAGVVGVYLARSGGGSGATSVAASPSPSSATETSTSRASPAAAVVTAPPVVSPVETESAAVASSSPSASASSHTVPVAASPRAPKTEPKQSAPAKPTAAATAEPKGSELTLKRPKF